VALNQLGLGFVFTAKDEATEVIERIKESFGELEHQTEHVTHAAKSSFADFGKGLAIFAAGTAIVGGAFELAEQGDKFIGAIEQAGAAAISSASPCVVPASRHRTPRKRCGSSSRRVSTPTTRRRRSGQRSTSSPSASAKSPGRRPRAS
jgi:hypothetical protein